MNIIADFTNSIEDVINSACKFWELDPSDYQIVDEKSVTLSRSMSIRDIYTIKGGVHKINFEMINKYTTQFEVLKSHWTSSEIDGQVTTAGQNTNTGSKKFRKVIRISKMNENKLENAPEKFLKRYPKMKEYINLSEKDANAGTVKRNKAVDKFHQRGPFVFYIIFLIIIIQLIQLNHFDVGMINNLRGSLNNLFYIKSKQGSRLENINYFSEMTSSLGFQDWMKNMTSNLYHSNLYDEDTHYKPNPNSKGKDDSFAINMPNNFFSQKCMFLGPPILIKFDTKVKGKNTYYIEYNEQTMSNPLLTLI